MIYQVKDNKKIPLGTQFDNSWEIEYDRDLSSQLKGLREWTATEDCWFQYLSLGFETTTQAESNYKDLWIELNGVKVSLWSYDTQSIPDKRMRECSASLLLKKGDTVKIRWTNESSTATFVQNQTKVFPIHRILSKEEERIIHLKVNTERATSDVTSLEVEAVPFGKNKYMFYGQIQLKPENTGTTCHVELQTIDDYEFLNLVGQCAYNKGEGVVGGGRTYSNYKIFNYYINATSTEQITFTFQGIVKRV